MTISLDYHEVAAMPADIMQRLGREPPPVIREADFRSTVNRRNWSADYEGGDVLRQAAKLATGIACSHGFVDGNKRTSYGALLVLLGLNALQVGGPRLDIGALISAP